MQALPRLALQGTEANGTRLKGDQAKRGPGRTGPSVCCITQTGGRMDALKAELFGGLVEEG